jgi:hypothetical protein
VPEAVKAVNLGAIAPYLQPRSNEWLVKAVEQIEAGIAAGMVPNKQFSDAKDWINRAVHDSAEAFLNSGPHEQKHHQSDWWLAAYQGDAFISGAHNVPSALKRAQKIAALGDYAAFISNALLPLHGLLASAKPLIKKRGELPKVPSPKQLAEEGERMTCQCCGRKILANLGSIAHHGYERPEQYYQTASCYGAKKNPFEADRAALGEMIGYMRDRLARNEKHRAAIKSEKLPIVFDYESQLIGPSRFQQFGRWTKWPVVKRSFDVTRESFEAFKAGPGRNSTYGMDFDAYKARHVEYLSSSIKRLRQHINEEQKRYDGWKQSHEWKGGQWVALEKEKA